MTMWKSQRCILLAALLALACLCIDTAPAQTGDIRPVHDPVMIREGGMYYIFSTGKGIPMRRSTDREHWELVGDVFEEIPAWAAEDIPEARDMWAPDISRVGDWFYLYYSVSVFGTNKSDMGLARNKTLDPDSPDYRWEDRGKVLQSRPGENDWNVIDPQLVEDEDGNWWLAFGSFWSGIRMAAIDPNTGKPLRPDEEPAALACRPVHRAIEAPYIIHRDGFYYLFVSFDQCCRGADSTYNTRVGRAPAITGPYADREGKPMMEGGGTIVLEGGERWRGPGHCAVYTEGGQDWIVYHAYDAENKGARTLRIIPLSWSDDGWPQAELPAEAETLKKDDGA